ncbi:MAG: GNAT family N-acetyltransferase [Alphaproteobacteria bacterium]|nr:GNAT family N-acetyltransferase [Alphaproteobacteria bacterium]MBU1512684.1 GNAT family N-acetyltransferase [Alphaproteobacteria bacterium]MBU2095078.1 GNAT family N-acetyltransferase [Alphaproteobacteria bacterium]MBU2151803.1 GNAT family N-acetyltransferase [Alphaproteobacteria bacterium]MBU2306202.1 GNAT family N-acetyltransferase [Alphaproteobacteria bacterium]
MSLTPAVKVSRRIAEIGREAWDACADNPAYDGNPFIRFDFLNALEEAHCAVERTGWGPQHLSIEDADGRVAAVMPLYLKSHSQGEYIFDHAWADAYERAGGKYYPKLLSAAPFVPATGPRLLARPDVDQAEAWRLLLGGGLTLCERYGASGLNLNFLTQAEWAWMGEQGLGQREGQQYHWENRGYRDFEDFLGALSSGRRKTIRRERRDAQAQVEIACLTGAEITEDHWDAFFGFYMDTGSRKWGRPYLTRAFFSLLGERMADRVLLVMARRDGQWIAGALNLIGGDCLYGRHWGCVDEVPFLHFELCYYQAIEWAIDHGLPRVEAGAQGQHKIARGYLPKAVYSAHYIADPMLRGPVERFLAQEREGVEQEMEWLEEEFSPFKDGV